MEREKIVDIWFLGLNLVAQVTLASYRKNASYNILLCLHTPLLSELKNAELWVCERVLRPVGSTRMIFRIHL
jgi:hypothetical protein